MNYLKNYLIFILTIVFFSACNLSGKKSRANYQTKFVSGSTKNKIEIVDFGGTGKPILFLTGLGNSAYVFADFAPKFCDKFHVYVMSRRGFGGSEQTTNGYSIDTLSMDILAVTKALNFSKVILVGHSIAGDEISKFASSYPDKVDKVIYLDAAFDRTNLMAILGPHYPASPLPTAIDSSSIERFKLYRAQNLGVNLPEEEIRNISLFSDDGKYQKDVTPPRIQGQIISGIERPNYKDINCPALSIYAIPSSIYTMIPFYDSLDTENKKKADTCFVKLKNYSKQQIAVFKKEVKKGIVKEVKEAHHCIFISNPVITENLIREFLK